VVRTTELLVPALVGMRVMMTVLMASLHAERQVYMRRRIVLLTLFRRHPAVRMGHPCPLTGKQA